MLSDASVCFVFTVSPPLLSSRPETDAAPVIDYVDDGTSSFSVELPGKPPFDHPDIAHSILSCLH